MLFVHFSERVSSHIKMIGQGRGDGEVKLIQFHFGEFRGYVDADYSHVWCMHSILLELVGHVENGRHLWEWSCRMQGVWHTAWPHVWGHLEYQKMRIETFKQSNDYDVHVAI
jgi:hypothetical protein